MCVLKSPPSTCTTHPICGKSIKFSRLVIFCKIEIRNNIFIPYVTCSVLIYLLIVKNVKLCLPRTSHFHQLHSHINNNFPPIELYFEDRSAFSSIDNRSSRIVIDVGPNSLTLSLFQLMFNDSFFYLFFPF